MYNDGREGAVPFMVETGQIFFFDWFDEKLTKH
jgi:hypothetical protein